MGLFSFSQAKRLPWTDITSVEQLQEVLDQAKEHPVLLFKHSTRCSISTMTLNSFEQKWSSENELCQLYFVDLLRNRDVSNAIAAETGVSHQSPQAIVLKGEEVVYHASHSSIEVRAIEKILKNK